MWIFLATEVLFFGGMFVAYAVYRVQYGDVFHLGSEHLNLWSGGAMTAILLTGSLLIAVANQRLTAAKDSSSSVTGVVWRLLVTALLGMVFLGLEFYEYGELISDGLFPGRDFASERFAAAALAGRSAEMFFVLFFCMTGLHAIHMMIGVCLVAGAALMTKLSSRPTRLANSSAVIALYWHFVDIVWVFLYPLFYLVN